MRNNFGVEINRCPGTCNQFIDHVNILERWTKVEKDPTGEMVEVEHTRRVPGLHCAFQEEYVNAEQHPCWNCKHYEMSMFWRAFNPNNCKQSWVKPKAFFEWISTVDMSKKTTGLTHKNKMNKIEFNDGALWDYWIKNTNEGRLYIAEYPDRR